MPKHLANAIAISIGIAFASEPAHVANPVRAADSGQYFTITVVDDQTHRGVPLVELRTVNDIRFYTDSNGVVAFDEPGLMGREVFFHVSSHGYEFAKDGFGYAGTRLRPEPGVSVELKIKRINIAERLYRITGGGIYRDSVLVGKAVPLKQPVLCGDVLGQDTIQNVIYRNRICWFWGDTNWPAYPLGNFHMSGATSRLPAQGGLDPDVGVDLTYFVRDNGFAKEMAPHAEPGPVWMDALVNLLDGDGKERLYGAYARVDSAMKPQERGLMWFNDEQQVFEIVTTFDRDAPAHPGGHPFVYAEGGQEYIWFPTPFPLVRVRANAEAYLDVTQYEAWTPLVTGARVKAGRIDRDSAGRIQYAWKKNTPPLGPQQTQRLIKEGKLKPSEAWEQLQDVDSGERVTPHAGSVFWNDYRQRWITIRCQHFGTSVLGEIWYAEADTPLGPWVYARKIVTHDNYTFYNPKQHPYFDQDRGRVIFFEGTFVNTFSGNPQTTPRYEYNQIMYKLSLDDERLVLPVPVYRLPEDDVSLFATRVNLPDDDMQRPIAFFALDRKTTDSIAISVDRQVDGSSRLIAHDKGDQLDAQKIVFYALPASLEKPPATTTPLYEYTSSRNPQPIYAVEGQEVPDGYQRSNAPLCHVWRQPLAAWAKQSSVSNNNPR